MTRLEFPEITDVDMVFGGFPRDWFYKTLKLPKNREYSDMASKLFFSGGTVPVHKQLDTEYVKKGLRLLRSVLRTFDCKHEHKEHVAGLILQSLCEP